MSRLILSAARQNAGGGGSLTDGDSVNVTITGSGSKSTVAPAFFFYPAESAPALGTTYADGGAVDMVVGSGAWNAIGTNEANMSNDVVNTNMRTTSADRVLYQFYTTDPIGTSGWAMGLEFSFGSALTNGDDLYVATIGRQSYNQGAGVGGETDLSWNNKELIIYSNARGGGEYYSSGNSDIGSNNMTIRTGGNATGAAAPNDNAQFTNRGVWDTAHESRWLTIEHELTAGVQDGNGFSRRFVHEWDTGDRETAWDGTTSVATWESGNDWNFIRLYEYFRWAQKEDWVELIYIDTTWQRVVISESATWSATAVHEIQRCTSWAADSITFSYRRGGLSSGVTLYAYAIDASGAVVNSSGVAIN